jgi:hypothetical protein
MPGRHEAPNDTDPFMGVVLLGLIVVLAVTIILAVALRQGDQGRGPVTPYDATGIG